jgi:hypothetical protein
MKCTFGLDPLALHQEEDLRTVGNTTTEEGQ